MTMNRMEAMFRSKRREYILVFLFFLVMAILFTWPLILHMHNGVLGGHHNPLLNTWIISWDANTIFTNPTNLFQGNIIYPSRDVLAYSEHLFLLGVMAAPIYHASGNPMLAYNLLLLLGMVFSAFGCYILAKEFTSSRWGGLVGGLFYAYCPYKLGIMGHIQIFFAPFLPLMLLYLYRYLHKGGRRNVFLFGLFFLLQSLVSWHYLVFCSLVAGLMWLWAALFSRRKTEWLRLAAVAAALVLAAAFLIPFALPYLRLNRRLPNFGRNLEEVELYSATTDDYLSVLPESVIYGDAPGPFREGSLVTENTLYPGVMVIMLALAGLFIRKKKEGDPPVFGSTSYRRGPPFFLLLTFIGFILTFGPEIGGMRNPLYTLLFHLGVLKFIRYSSRFYVLVVLGLSVLAAYGTAKLAVRISGWRKSWRAGRLAAAVLVALLLLEMLAFNFTVYPVPAWGDVPEVYTWLEEQGDVRVIDLPASPLDHDGNRYDDWNMDVVPESLLPYLQREGLVVYMSTYHWKQTTNGYSGYTPFFYRRIFTEMQAFPSQRNVELLRGLGIDFVFWHWNWVEEEERDEYRDRLLSTPGLSLEKDFVEWTIFRVEPGVLASVEDLEASLQAPSAVPEGESFNLGILVKNECGSPLVIVEEDLQTFHLSFLDKGGNVVNEEKGTYRAPFFLQGGEETSVPLKIEATPEEGAYQMQLELEGGVLGRHDLQQEIKIVEPEDLVGSGVLSGSVALKKGAELVEIPIPDGLYPLVLTVHNDGDTLWRSGWEEEQVGGHYPFGLVYLGMKWGENGELVWGEQGGVLPCDVSPGQSVEVPVLARPPDQPGTYELLFVLRDKDVDWFGQVLLIEADICQ